MSEFQQGKGEVECLAALKKITGSDVKVVEHEEVKTVDAWRPVMEKMELDGLMAKNMFLKGKKGELILVFALAETKTDMKVTGKATGCGNNLRFAPEDILQENLGVIQGAVTPLALINDAKKAVTVVLDKAAAEASKPLFVHPCRNDKTVMVAPKDLLTYFAELEYKPIIVDFAAEAAAAAAAPAPAAKKPAPKKEKKAEHVDPNAKGETKLSIQVKKSENFADWYSQVITKADMIEYYDVSGCYIIRPWAFAIWDEIRRFFADEIRKMGVEECYFPMFVSKNVLEKEKDHVEGFAPEVAWVTKAGDDDLENPIAIRPTSETVMYPCFAKWIKSHRDMPVRLNQWCNVVRWEFSHPTPFIRTREFLWQEGHCAWATNEECAKEVRQILDLYKAVYEELLAVPVVPGVKTEKEKFAGGFYTTTAETFVPEVGRGCQGATSHHLGQNFGKMFNINFEDPKNPGGEKLCPYQNSWGITTRTIGVMTMVHGDDKGLVLPPRVAQQQVVIVPVGVAAKTSDEERERLYKAVRELESTLMKGGVRTKADLRDNYSPGWRFNHWEVKGVPVRIELGFKELEAKKLVLAIRYSGKKEDITWDDNVAATMKGKLEEIQASMLANAWERRNNQTKRLTDWKDFTPTLNEKNLILAPWCEELECENNVKKFSAEESKAMQEDSKEDDRAPSMGAKSLCMPYAEEDTPLEGLTCICRGCTKKAKKWVLWGRSY